jgi:hypothetical protein
MSRTPRVSAGWRYASETLAISARADAVQENRFEVSTPA